MTLETLTPEFVLEETAKLQRLYKLKREIRFNQKRTELLTTESVAEHIFGMHIIAPYFLRLEYPRGGLNEQRMYELITWHDIAEVVSGDIMSWVKTDADRAREKDALRDVILGLPSNLTSYVSEITQEYEDQVSPESRFVKGIDKIEPLFEMYNENGVQITRHNGQTLATHEKAKYPYLKEFPYMRRFCEVITAELVSMGAFKNDESVP